MKFFLLMNVKVPTTVGISTIMNRKNRIVDLSDSENAEFLDIITFMSIKISAQLS